MLVDFEAMAQEDYAKILDLDDRFDRGHKIRTASLYNQVIRHVCSKAAAFRSFGGPGRVTVEAVNGLDVRRRVLLNDAMFGEIWVDVAGDRLDVRYECDGEKGDASEQ
jgi:hypothetical protein